MQKLTESKWLIFKDKRHSMKVFWIICCACLWLQGCMNVAMSGANLFYDRDHTSSTFENYYDHHSAELALDQSVDLNADSRVELIAFDDTLLVVGQVPNERVREEVIAVLLRSSKVNTVVDQLTIGPPISASVIATDSWITTKLLTQYYLRLDLNPRAFKILTENGVVYLMGRVSEAEADTITLLARQTDGVKKVVNLFRYVYYL